MPWTEKQVRFLLSKGSPLTDAQKDKDKAELHANPSMGHKKKLPVHARMAGRR
jgi:hypothetical protein